MNLTKAQGSRVDFIALHYYATEFEDVDAAVDNFKAYIQRVPPFSLGRRIRDGLLPCRPVPVGPP